MRLLIVRHGPAGDRDEFAFTGRPDAERPLTRDGRAKMKRASAGLASTVEGVSMVATSTLVRAEQTAELVAAALGVKELVRLPELAPERAPEDLLPWLRTHDPDAVVAVVGHDPHLGFLLGWLLTGRHETFVELKKGGAALLEFEDPPAAGGAILHWALAPAQLRALGKGK